MPKNAVACVFDRDPSDPLRVEHLHTQCKSALRWTDEHRWHPEPVVFATRRLYTMAQAVPLIRCATCTSDVVMCRDGWAHMHGSKACHRDGDARYLAHPDAGSFAGFAEMEWRERPNGLAPYLACHALEEFGPWSPHLPAVYAAIGMIGEALRPEGFASGDDPLTVGQRILARIGADAQLTANGFQPATYAGGLR